MRGQDFFLVGSSLLSLHFAGSTTAHLNRVRDELTGAQVEALEREARLHRVLGIGGLSVWLLGRLVK